MTKRITLLLFVVAAMLTAKAQTQADWVEMMNDPAYNFYDVQANFEAYWQDRAVEKGKGFKQFKRWEAFMEPRIYPTGERPSPAVLYQAKLAASTTFPTQSGDWKPLGPFNGNAINGIGRVNRLTFHPTNAQIVYACTASGGVWVTTDGGNSWDTYTDLLPNIGSSDLVINPHNPNIMYLATGDRDGGDTYSFGVLKSTDGGLSWNPTGLVHSVNQRIRISDLYMHPDHPDTLLASTRSGIYRTTDAGETWNFVQGGSFNEIVQRPNNPNTLFTSTISSGGSRIYRSLDNGLSWLVLTDPNLPTGGVRRIELGVTPEDPDYIYALCGASNNGFYGLYRSIDGGNTWTQRSNSPNLMGWSTTGSDVGGQAWYDLAIAVDPNDKERVYTGGVNIWTSGNGGSTWSLAAHWFGGGGAPYVHADIHDLDYSPSGQLWAGTDGGFYSENESINDWDEHNDGLNITQYYKIGSAANDTNRVIAGSQDNGTHLMRIGRNWDRVRGGDGMDCAISSKNSNVMYSSVYYGDFRKSINGGNSFNAAFNLPPAGGGNWVTPLVLDPLHPDTIYTGFSRVWRSFNGGSSFSAVSPSTLTGGANIDHMALAPRHTNVLYVAEGDRLWRSENYGATWVNLSSRIPGSASISHISVSYKNPLHVVITRSGYSNAQKVYQSFDGGNSWQNISGSLPNIPANCVTHMNDNSGGLYVGTDVGIYYRDKNMNNWVSFNAGLPNVIVNELEINYINRRIRAGTYGRGLYESPLFGNEAAPIAALEVSLTSCTGDTVHLKDVSSYNPNSWQWHISPATYTFINGTDASTQNPQLVFSQPGVYNISLRVSNAYGADSTIQISAVHAGGRYLPYTQDFELDEAYEEWSSPASAANKWFTKIGATGNGGQYAPGVRFVNSNNQGDEVALISPLFNFSGHDSVWLSFEYAYTSFQANNDDSLKVYIAGPCNNKWTLLATYGEDGSNNFVTRSPQAAAFTPTIANHWCGTAGFADCKLLDLSAYANMESIRLKFVAVDGGGNSIFVDNINLFGKANSAPIAAFSAPQNTCAQRSLQMTDQSFGSPSSYTWTFPGGTPATSTLRNPSVVYSSAGTYPVKLKVSNTFGADSLERLSYITVDPAANVNITLSANLSTKLCPGDSLLVTANATQTGLTPTFDWYVNGNLVASTTTPQYTFTGLIDGDLIHAELQSSEACAFPLNAYSDTLTANFHPPVTPIFTSSTLSCNSDAPFTLSATPAGGTFSGNGVNGNTFDPSLAGAGLFPITYTYTDANGCTFEGLVAVITVNAPPTIAFPMPDLCIGEGSLMLNMAQPVGGSYSGTGVRNGFLHPDSVGVGTHQITYTYASPGCAPVSETVSYTVYPEPARPLIILRNDSLICVAPHATAYQWYSTSSIIPGSVGQGYKPTVSFTYFVRITDANGCEATSDTFAYNIGIPEQEWIEQFELFPNPAREQVYVKLRLKAHRELTLSLTSMSGALLRKERFSRTREIDHRLNLEGLARGMYILNLEGDGRQLSRKLTIE